MRPKKIKRTNKELAMGLLYDWLTSEPVDSDDVDDHAKKFGLSLSSGRQEKVADQANEILHKLVMKRIGSYLQKRGDDISSPTELSRSIDD